MRKIVVIFCFAALAACGVAAEKSTVSVMSFNVRLDTPIDGANTWENRKEAAVGMVAAIKPDIFGLQEALAWQYDYIAENLPGYSHVGVGRDDGEREGEIMAVFFDAARYDLLDSGTFWLSETPGEVSRGWDGQCNRTATWVELREKGGERSLWFFNTHLDHRGALAREEGVKLLVRKIDEIAGKGPVFVTGDFNASPQDAVLAPMFDGFGSARDDAPQTDNLGTFNGFGSAPNSIVIDYIFYRKAHALSFKTITENYGVPYISDHYPLVATLEF